jgi:hypothetical protein
VHDDNWHSDFIARVEGYSEYPSISPGCRSALLGFLGNIPGQEATSSKLVTPPKPTNYELAMAYVRHINDSVQGRTTLPVPRRSQLAHRASRPARMGK